MNNEQSPSRSVRNSILFGQLIEVESHAGQARVRIHTGGADVWFGLASALVERTRALCGTQVELRVEESLAGESVTVRTVRNVRALDPDECGVDVPDRSITELAGDQGLNERRQPDYFSILSDLWESDDEAEAFREEIRRARNQR